MNTELAKEMMDSFYEAKRIRDQLPPLPDGINPSYITTLDVILQLSGQGESSRVKSGRTGPPSPVRVSDVAHFRGLPRPTVTRTVKEMEAKGLLSKRVDSTDRRIVHLEVTAQGRALYQTYVKEYFKDLSEKLSGISDEEARSMIGTIHRIGQALQRP